MSAQWPRGRWSFKLVDDARVHEQVVDQITFAIRSGAFAIGDRLPSVPEMAREMGVSKPTIGEAIRVLGSRGVVESRRGANGGVTVVDDNIPPALLGRPNDVGSTSLRELIEARRPVEMELARLAGERASGRDFESMQESIDRMVAHTNHERTTALHFDHFFHYALARAAQCGLLAYYHHQILKGITVAMHDFMLYDEDPDVVVELHQRTLDAIMARDPAQIAEVMDEHLAHLEHHVERLDVTGRR
ncbi:FadR/GntR family transcriptional regulator [Streptomyces sp. CA-106131]|uniref:FadR/GntR family transcriptional regulator n=1 Tax=Streptomyces sp. CA-106131 TaxID=3240045 RepID=UPI003D8EEF25